MCLQHFRVLQKTVKKLPEDGVDKCQNVSELRSY